MLCFCTGTVREIRRQIQTRQEEVSQGGEGIGRRVAEEDGGVAGDTGGDAGAATGV